MSSILTLSYFEPSKNEVSMHPKERITRGMTVCGWCNDWLTAPQARVWGLAYLAFHLTITNSAMIRNANDPDVPFVQDANGDYFFDCLLGEEADPLLL